MSATIAFKEWANVCEALITGQSALILRKGGIHEGRGGFEFKHAEFFLFPTWFHTQNDQLSWTPEHPERFQFPPEEQRTSVDIDGFATLEQVWRLTNWDQVAALAPLHVWSESIVRERFAYDDETCLNVALVRVWRLASTWSFPYAKSYGGCRSWITLPEPPDSWRETMTPALSEERFTSLAAQVRQLLA